MNTSNSASSQPIACSTCNHPLGTHDAPSSGFRLHKHALAISPSTDAPPTSYPTENWISATILDVVTTSGARKLLLKHPASTSQAWLLWIITPDLWIASAQTTSDNHSTKAFRAMKVLYRSLEPTEEATNASDTEELELPEPLGAECMTCLQRSREMLPQDARYRGVWDVGFLGRFDGEDVDGEKWAGGVDGVRGDGI